MTTPAPASTSLSPADVELADRLRLCVGRLVRRVRRAEPGAPPPLRRAVLEDLARHGGLVQSELARIEGVADSTMSRVVKSLLRDELAEQAVDASDARCRRVHLTERGRRFLRGAAAHDTDVLRSRLRRLSPDALATVVAALPLLEAMVGEGEPHSEPVAS